MGFEIGLECYLVAPPSVFLFGLSWAHLSFYEATGSATCEPCAVRPAGDVLVAAGTVEDLQALEKLELEAFKSLLKGPGIHVAVGQNTTTRPGYGTQALVFGKPFNFQGNPFWAPIFDPHPCGSSILLRVFPLLGLC